MAMMSQLLDKIKPKTLEQRLAELPTLSMEALTLIIEGDDPESLRIAAVAHLVDSPVLTALAVANDSLKLQQAAKIRIASLIDDGSIVVDEFSHVTIAATHTTQRTGSRSVSRLICRRSAYVNR